ncbi:MAG: DUF1702 family protein [bacterium]|nr:DUF1702 family protein [bacterium]
MRSLLRPLLSPLLRRDAAAEIGRQVPHFRIETDAGRELVTRLGTAFLDGYNAMLETRDTDAVRASSEDVETHFRPFYLEGAGMGYLAATYVSNALRPEHAERDLLRMDGRFLYLYYVGLGFWYGFRHARRPERLEQLRPHLDPMFFPLCHDGYGFKLGFFDYPTAPDVVRRLERCPATERPHAYQGFGRSMFFVYMHDQPGFDALREKLPERHRHDLEFGRSLACGFTGVDRPDELVAYIEAAPDESRRDSRLLGVTWALTARRMNDPSYLEACLKKGSGRTRAILEPLPDLCDAQKATAGDYAGWQWATSDAARIHYEAV